MFEKGNRVKMSEEFVFWCNENVKSIESSWISWSGEALEITKVEVNPYDPAYIDLHVRPEYSSVDSLMISIYKSGYGFCFAPGIIPFILTNGIRLSNAADDRCKICGAPGKIVRMACICSKCGQLVWGI